MPYIRWLFAVGVVCLAGGVAAEETLDVLFLTKSSTFVHGSIKRRDGELGHAEKALVALGERNGMTVRATKDAGEVNAKDLKNYDVVVFYTTGDLTESGSGSGLFGGDGHPPMGESGLEELLKWVRNGGGFVGYHCAADTFHGEDDTVSPYIEMLGGEFVVHGRQFVGRVMVVDPEHPAMRRFPDGWTHREEWYTFKNYDKGAIRVLAMLDTTPERSKQPMYDRDPYPIIWCRTFGQGRVFYNAIGHRNEIWDEEHFQHSVVDAIRWASGRGEAAATPNFEQVVKATE